MPFQPGNKLGKGRPKKDHHIVDACKIHSMDCVKMLAGVVRSSEEKTNTKITAAQLILGYAWGKPKQSSDVAYLMMPARSSLKRSRR